MWRDNVKDKKKELGLTVKEMAIKSKGKLNERQITRLISGEYKTPFVDDVLALGETVGLSPKELFGEANQIISSAQLPSELEQLRHKVEMLEIEIKYKDELIGLYKKFTEE